MDIIADFKQAFYTTSNKTLTKEYITDLIGQSMSIYEKQGESSELRFLNTLYRGYDFRDNNLYGVNLEDLQQEIRFMLRSVVIDYFWLYNIHMHFFSKEEIEKMEMLKSRNDYKSKLFTKLLYYCEYYMNREEHNSIHDIKRSIDMIFKLKMGHLLDGYINKSIGKISKWVTKIVGKVPPLIFIAYYKKKNGNVNDLYYRGNRFINDFLTQHEEYKHLIDSNRFGIISTLKYTTYDLIEKEFNLLIDEPNSIHDFRLLLDIMGNHQLNNEIYLLIDKVFTSLLSKEKVTEVVKLGYPIAYGLTEFKADFIHEFGRHFIQVYGLKKNNTALYGLYPLVIVKNIDNYVNEGRQVFTQFITDIYGNQSTQFIHLFESPNVILRELESDINVTKNPLWVRSYYEINRNFLLNYNQNQNSDILKYFSPIFYDDDQAIKRFYLTCYVIYRSRPKDFNALIFSHLNFMFLLIEKKLGIVPIRKNYILDMESKKSALREFLLTLGYDSNSSKDYEISFLDREVATLEEQDRFAALEQIGDAIYEIVVTEAELWDLDIDVSRRFTEKKISYINAKAQQVISESLGLDKFYIHYPFFKKTKFDDFEKAIEQIDQYGDPVNDNKSYLADTLEMLIGSIYYDLGINEAIEFTKKVVFSTYPELNKINHDLIDLMNNQFMDIEQINSINIEKLELLDRVKPNFRILYDNRWSNDDTILLSVFGSSLLKYLSIRYIGNDSLEKRKKLRRFNDYIQHQSINKIDIRIYIAYVYLNYGLDKAEEAFSQKIAPKYKDAI